MRFLELANPVMLSFCSEVFSGFPLGCRVESLSLSMTWKGFHDLDLSLSRFKAYSLSTRGQGRSLALS